MPPTYAPLHLHTEYSLLDGASTIAEYVEAAASMSLPALALTDTNALYGAVPFYKAARAARLKPIIGACIQTPSARAVFLAENASGYRSLCRLVTTRHLDPSFDLLSAAVKYSGGLVTLSSDTAFLEKAAPHLTSLYAELPAPAPRTRLRRIFSAARSLSLPLIATPAAHFVSPSGHTLHRVLSSVRQNTLLANLPPSACAPPSAYLRTPAEMAHLFRHVPEALSNTLRIADRCSFDFSFGKYHFPRACAPPGESPFSHLSRLAFEGAHKRYRPLTPPSSRASPTSSTSSKSSASPSTSSSSTPSSASPAQRASPSPAAAPPPTPSSPTASASPSLTQSSTTSTSNASSTSTAPTAPISTSTSAGNAATSSSATSTKPMAATALP